MPAKPNFLASLAKLERALKRHDDAEIKNLDRLRNVPHDHTAAMCLALESLLTAFHDKKIVALVEAEVSELGCTARPEDLVVWIEDTGVFVVEVKSHSIDGIRSFENNVPQVVYDGNLGADVDLLDQPKDFAYKLKAELEKAFDDAEQELPALYFAGWLPNVSPEEIASRSHSVAPDRVWLADMLDHDAFLARLDSMKNLTRGEGATRSTLSIFCSVFGSTSGLHRASQPRPNIRFATLGHLIDRKNLSLKRLTKEQEDLAFSPNLVRGPKVIRGVAGSGKTVVLANAVAQTFLRAKAATTHPELFPESGSAKMPRVLVLCFNRSLVPYLRKLVRECFEKRKSESDWQMPTPNLEVVNIDRYVWGLCDRSKVRYDYKNGPASVPSLLESSFPEKAKFDHIFIDEGQDVDLGWYPLIRALARDQDEGKSICVFYDEAQNLYGVKMPGVGTTAPWKEHLGTIPNPRGLQTVMRIGHRNTNQILSFSFNLLIGAFAVKNPQTVQFAGISAYESEVIPDDPQLNHRHAGRPCVERLDDRQFRINFAVDDGPPPEVRACRDEQRMLVELARAIQAMVDQSKDNVDPSDILVMAPHKEHVARLRDELANLGVRVHVPHWTDESREEKRKRSSDPRDQGCFKNGHVTVSTIKGAKGYTAHVCHVAFVHSLEDRGGGRDGVHHARAELHVGCTRSSLYLQLWGVESELMREAELAREALA